MSSMPVIHFTDGTWGELPYSKAARIHEIMTGEATRPPTEAEAEFCERVARVQFPTITPKLVNRRLPEPDPALHELMADTTLYGREKYLAIGRHLRSKLTA